MKPEDRLLEQIDALRSERRPEEPVDAEEAELLAVARLVKGLGKPVDPSLDFARRLLEGAPAQTATTKKRRWLALPAAAAVVAAVALSLTFMEFGRSFTVVQAMEQKVAQIDSYHAVIEHTWQGGSPTRVETETEEVWYQGEKYAWKNRSQEEVISDGEREWTVNHRSAYIHAGFPLTPKLHPFQPANLLKGVANQPYTIEGVDQIAGRQASRVRFEVKDLKSYRIWIDNETKLPLQIQMEHWGDVTSTMTYKTFELNKPIDAARFAAPVVEGYTVVDGGTKVASIAEAAALAGFQPVLPKESPRLIVVQNGSIQLGFGDVEITQQPEPLTLSMDQRQSYGWTGVVPVQTMGSQVFMWNQGRVGIHMSGSDRALELARQIAPDLSLPYEPYRNPYLVPLIEEPVQVDMAAAMAAEVEHAKLFNTHMDHHFPLSAAKQFAREQGASDQVTMFEAGNNKAEAIVTVKEGPISKIYLRRVARQDDQGLWWVIGYDRR